MEKKPEERKCPHCEKVIEPEPMTEEVLMAIVGFVRSAEIAAGAMDTTASQAAESSLRLVKAMLEGEGTIDILAITGRVQ